MNRDSRSRMAQETLTILQTGQYETSRGVTVSIKESLSVSCAQTILYRPEDFKELIKRAGEAPEERTSIQVNNRTTLEAGRALASVSEKVICLNFASAKNPGGGFLSGSQAQEESLARSSGLYLTLQTQPEFYEFHRRGSSCLYSDHAIYSPQVPVFRDDSGQLLSNPWQCGFITVAAVNAGAVRCNEPEKIKDIVPVMEQRTRAVLSIAISHGCQVLVLGAWGCGVFQNDPAEIADIFARVLTESPFRNRFKHIEFAVYDPSEKLVTVTAFRERFSNS